MKFEWDADKKEYVCNEFRIYQGYRPGSLTADHGMQETDWCLVGAIDDRRNVRTWHGDPLHLANEAEDMERRGCLRRERLMTKEELRQRCTAILSWSILEYVVDQVERRDLLMKDGTFEDMVTNLAEHVVDVTYES